MWRNIASFLPRRDLKMLLSLPHILSRIAFERVFQRVDLTLGAVSTGDNINAVSSARFSGRDEFIIEDENMEDARSVIDERQLYTDEDVKLEKVLHQRTADIISRIVMDPGFAKLVKSLRISASIRTGAGERRGTNCNHISFQISTFWLRARNDLMSDVLFLAMFLTALPKLLNLQELIFTGNNEVWNTLAAQLGSTHPRLASLTIE